MQLSVIIINYRTPELTAQAVKSVYDSLEESSSLKNNLEVIVVDNHSGDQSVAKLKKLCYPHYKLLVSKENLGFSGGNNLAFKSATGQYLLFLNSDALVFPGSLEKMMNFYLADRQQKKRRHLGLLAAQLYNQDGTYQPQGGDLPNWLTLFTNQFFLDDLPLLNRFIPSVQHTGRRFNEREIKRKTFISKGWVAGTAVMVWREYLETLGAWDENIFMYGEDQELSYRLHQARLIHGILTDAGVTHLGSASSSSKNAITGELKGYLYFFSKYYCKFYLLMIKLILWWGVLLRLLVYTFIRKDAQRRASYLAALDIIEKSLFSF